jgi:hypothetical protein
MITFEFSSKTVDQLKEAGYEDAGVAIDIESVRNAVMNLINNGIINEEEVLILEEKLQAAITQAKHQNIEKAIERRDELFKTAADTAQGKSSIVDKQILMIQLALKVKVRRIKRNYKQKRKQ